MANWRRLRLGSAVWATVALAIIAAVFAADAVGAAAGDCDAVVTDQAGLNSSIACYNAEAVAGAHTITIVNNITYTTTSTAINNTTAGVTLTIDGAGFTVDAASNGGVFSISNGEVTFDSLTITGGDTVIGGGIYMAAGTARVTNSTLSTNTASDSGAGIFNQAGALTVINSTISMNSAVSLGGGIYNSAGALEIYFSTITENSALSNGAGVRSLNGSTTVGASIIADNTGSGDVAGSSFTSANFNVVGDGDGAATFTQSRDVDNVLSAQLGPLADNGGPTHTHFPLVTSAALNRFNVGGGAQTWDQALDQRGVARFAYEKEAGAVEAPCYNPSDWDVTSAPQLDTAINCFNTAPSGDYVIEIDNAITYSAEVTAINNADPLAILDINGNGHTIDADSNGSVFTVNGTVRFNTVTISGGDSVFGGGIYIIGGSVDVNDSTVSDNQVSLSGAGISNEDAVLRVTRSTIANNTAAFGGGVFTSGSSGHTTVSNSTITGNQASQGGAIYGQPASIVNIYFSTVTENTAATGAGIRLNGGTSSIGASIVADNIGAGDIYESAPGLVASDGYNVIGDGNASASFVQNQDIVIGAASAGLGALADNGGPTQTHLPDASSPAIDRYSFASFVTHVWNEDIDQRGAGRFVTKKEAGAVEAPCLDSPTWTVNMFPQLSSAIDCYNAETSADSYRIFISFHIDYSEPIPTISNTTPNADLAIRGNGYTINANSHGRAFTVSAGDVTFDSVTITGGDAPFGGGIGTGGTVNVIDSTITGNVVSGRGGGIHNTGFLTVTNSTVSGNYAPNGGGGIYNWIGTTEIHFSTITNNTASFSGSGVRDLAGTTTVGASIIAGNNTADDLHGDFITDGFNVIGSGSGTGDFSHPQDIIGASAALGPLADNGGLSDTHMPSPSSPALDRYNIASGLPAWDQAVDQRGSVRAPGLKDAGATERESLLTVLPVPCPVLDTSQTGGGSQLSGSPRTVQVTGALPFGQGVPTVTCIPTTAGATAVLYTVSAINPTGPGNLRLTATGTTAQGGVVNYVGNGLNNANTVTVPIGPSGQVDISANGSLTDGRLVVVGYLSAAGTLRYNALTPCAVADSRTTGANPASGSFAGPFAGGAAYPDVDVAGFVDSAQGGNDGSTDCGVPAGADAVVVNLVAIKPQGAGGFGGPGYLSASIGGGNPVEPVTPFADLPLNNATAITVPLDSVTGKIAVDVDQITGLPVSTHIRIVVLGYLDDPDGDDYFAVNPCAAFDTRTTVPGDSNIALPPFAGKRSHSSPTIFNITGSIPAAQGGELDCGIPVGATAALVNLVAIQADFVGNLRAYATGSTPSGGVVNFAPLALPMNNSNAIAVPLDQDGSMTVDVNSPLATGPVVHLRGVILGYYT